MSTATKKPEFTPKQATYTIKEACIYLRLGDTALRDLIRRKLLRKSKAVRKIIIPGEDVETFVARTS